MDFLADLIDIVRGCFREDGIAYDGGGDPRELAALYCETRIRRIIPRPREVHFSEEIHASLGRLVRETDPDERGKALAAWRTVFTLRNCLARGEEVTRFLSKGVAKATSKDGMLWDFGMHHFHLCRLLDDRATFVERSDHLLFAITADDAAYFVDVRRHDDPERLGWVRQDLLRIVHSNWPALVEHHELRGVAGDRLTDQEKQSLRQRHLNHVTEIGGKAIGPVGWGVMANGSSAWCRVWGDKLIHEIKRHRRFFGGQPPEVRRALIEGGAKVAGKMEFRLMRMDDLSPSAELLEALKEDRCLSKDLCGMGFVVVEATTGAPVVVVVEDWSCPALTDTYPLGSSKEVSYGGPAGAVSVRVQGAAGGTGEERA
ncbi:hypothetical protein [Candidatus Palauibacter sp.]|uniref:hypothetical protein n=1 Tax=Candidatus Palauibacter sp. TaxID=3101350 RepID=UPI003B522465